MNLNGDVTSITKTHFSDSFLEKKVRWRMLYPLICLDKNGSEFDLRIL
jgi:hypothetical protein